MNEEYAYKDGAGRWTPGFSTRQAAIKAGLIDGGTQVTTAKVENECPTYFSRFEAKSILARLISGLQHGEEIGKLAGGMPAIAFLANIESAEPCFLEPTSTECQLQVD
jgi:hypothetical protein